MIGTTSWGLVPHVTTGAIANAAGRTILVADQGAIATGALTAADGIALLARGDVSTGAVETVIGGGSGLIGPTATVRGAS